MKKSYLFVLTLFLTSFFQVSGQTMTTENFNTAGTFTRTVPVTFTYEVTVRVFGAGGGGGTTAVSPAAAGGGGGGAYAESNLTLTAGDYEIIVGAGGTPGANGENSVFKEDGVAGTILVRAAGGEGSSEQSGALGGSIANSIGSTRFAGGNGGNAGNCGIADDTGGGGGGAASDGGAGGSGGIGTCAPPNGGTGGTGATGTNTVNGGSGGIGGEAGSGNFASTPGGGGGGKAEFAGAASAGGATGRIEIVINTILPIELISFEGKALKNTVELNWTTASEINNDYVAIERSDDAVNFVEIGRIEGEGDTEEERSYSFIDKAPLQGINYYRLRQVDFNGEVNRHAIIAVEVELEQVASNMSIYPNPSQGILQVEWDLPIRRMGTLGVYDITGKRLKQYTLDPLSASQQLSIQELPSGLYLLHFSTGDQVEVLRFEKE